MPHVSVNAHLASRSTLDLAVQAGCRGVRLDGNWPMLEPTRGHFDWGLLDDSIYGAKALDLEVLLTLSQIPAWANGGKERNVPPILIHDWQLFVQAVCERYRQHMAALEIWNEPNVHGFWASSVEQYVDYLLIPAVEVIRASAPGVKIAAPALSTEGEWPAWLATMLSQSRQVVDSISIHCYQKDGRAVWRAMSQTPAWWEFWKSPSVKHVIQEAGADHLPLWLTECGWNTADVSEAKQADCVDQLLEGWQTQPWVQALYLYQLWDEGHPVGGGLFRGDKSPKPVVQVIQRRTGGAV